MTLSDEDLSDPSPLEVRGAVRAPRLVPGPAGLLALLLLRRLDVLVGQGLLLALRRPSAVPAGGFTTAWDPVGPAPAHLLLPTATGAALRSRTGTGPGPLVVPPVVFMAVVGHLAGTPVEVRAGWLGLVAWLAEGTAARGPAPGLRPALATRLAAVAAARRVVAPFAALAAALPVRVPTRSVRWPLLLLSGALGVVPASALADSSARGLVRGE